MYYKSTPGTERQLLRAWLIQPPNKQRALLIKWNNYWLVKIIHQ